MENEINYAITEQEGVKIVRLSGSISNTSKQELEGILNEISQKSHIILNMSGISIITSGGLSSIINASIEARKRKKRVMILGLREGLAKTIEVMGVLQYITFIESIEEGLSRI